MNCIINFTPTGMIPTKKMTPLVPVTVQEIIDEVTSQTEKHDNRGLRKLIVNLAHDLEKRVDNPALYSQEEAPLENQVKTLAILIELLFSLE